MQQTLEKKLNGKTYSIISKFMEQPMKQSVEFGEGVRVYDKNYSKKRLSFLNDVLLKPLNYI